MQSAVTSQMSVTDAARCLGYGVNYVYTLIWAGKLEAHREDGRWFIPAEAVENRKRRRESD